ncbi:alpha/beta hydrolase [Patescibacteria group bacterium]|nr:alpha/beta hydrolase [Patescibacteria group bacterium]MBU1672977.1 alpha/beta hydrolase [Patescibacteria group bacterium]MBU1962988.1 alpha/beta hydrolase [Patescibacteria group bacterium]
MKPKYLLIAIIALIIILVGAAIGVYYYNPAGTTLPFLGDRTYNLAFETEDELNIAATYYPSAGTISDKGIILAHSQDTDRREWVDFAQQLQEAGLEVITMDLRGHGISEGNIKKFKKGDYRKMEYDIREAIEYLEDINGEMKIAILGSDLGANVAARSAAQDSRARAVVLMSPKLDFEGIEISKNIKRYSNPLLIIVSKSDKDSYDDSVKLMEKSGSEIKEFWEFDKSGHGSAMLEKEEGLPQRIIDWFNNNLHD